MIEVEQDNIWAELVDRTVLVGAIRYKVSEVPSPLVVGEKVCGGTMDCNAGTIEISDTVGEGAKPLFLMHELIHAIMFNYDIELGENMEFVVDSVAAGVVQLIRDNPKLVEYIQES